MANTDRDTTQHETSLDGEENFAPNMLMYEGYGRRIADARGKLSQAELGDAIGKGQSAISGYENESREPSLEDFEAIAKVTDTSPAWLAFGLGPKKPGGEFVATDDLDRERLFKIISGVERYLSSKNIRLTPEKKGRFVIAIYDSMAASSDEQILSQELERFLAIAKRT